MEANEKVMVRQKMTFKQFLKRYSTLLLLIFFIIVAAIASPNFLTLSNLSNILQSYAAPGIIAIGMTFTMLTGGVDLSVGSVAALSAMVSAMCLSMGVPVIFSVLLGVIVGGVLGTVTGLIVTFAGLEPFICSLATMVSARGLAMLTTDGKVISGLKNLAGGEAYCYLGGGSIDLGVMKLPISGITWIVITIIAALILKYTMFGRGIYAIGGNKEAATLSGIRVRLYGTIVWTISGILAGYAGIMTIAWLTTAQPTIMDGAELDAMASAVIGGTAMSGGKGGVVGTFAGVILLAIITNIFNLLGLQSYWQQIFKGIIIIAALLLNLFVSKQDD